MVAGCFDEYWVQKAIVTGIDKVENVTANLIGIDQAGEITEAEA